MFTFISERNLKNPIRLKFFGYMHRGNEFHFTVKWLILVWHLFSWTCTFFELKSNFSVESKLWIGKTDGGNKYRSKKRIRFVSLMQWIYDRSQIISKKTRNLKKIWKQIITQNKINKTIKVKVIRFFYTVGSQLYSNIHTATEATTNKD